MTGYLTGDVWSKLEFDLSEIRDLMQMRLETAEEQRGKVVSPPGAKERVWQDTAPRWEEPEAEALVRPWLMIPYVHAIDQEELQWRLEAGKCMLPSIERRVAARQLTPEFLHDWGLLNRLAGALQLIYFSRGSAGHTRSALAGGAARIDEAEAHRCWFAHYFLKHYRRGHRKEAEEAVERLINAIVDGRIEMPSGYEVHWFESYLKLDEPGAPGYAKLKPVFNEDSLSVKRMQQLKEIGSGGIPPIDLEFPDP